VGGKLAQVVSLTTGNLPIFHFARLSTSSFQQTINQTATVTGAACYCNIQQ